MISAAQLAKAAGCQIGRAEKWLPFFTGAIQRFEINSPARIAAFVAQCAHESGRLALTEENLNYSAKGLLAVFPKYFTPITAAQYERKPERIASRVYANRMGNGDEAGGDGWRYRGRGLIQLTGKNNYQACSSAMGVDMVVNPHLLATMNYAALSAAWFWKKNGLNELADKGDFVAITKRINGGTHGLDDRLALWKGAKVAMIEGSTVA